MAKVKIQGNASGTGVLTVEAPNTNTDRTITLPDATGTLLNSDGDGSSLTGVADATKLPLAGGTLTGNVTVSASGADASRTLSLQGTNGSSEVYQFNLIADGGNSAAKFMIGSGGGAASEKLRIQSGGGISFNGDTAAANALDDYEEGTFTPSITATGGGSISLYPGYDTLSYTKIGRMVTIIGKLAAQSVSSPSGDLRIGSLPFTSGDYADRAGVAAPMTLSYFNGSGVSTTGYYSTAALVAEGRTYAHIIVGSSSGGDTSIADWIGAGSDLFVTVQYIT